MLLEESRESLVGYLAVQDLQSALAGFAAYEEIRIRLANSQLTLKPEEISECSGQYSGDTPDVRKRHGRDQMARNARRYGGIDVTSDSARAYRYRAEQSCW